MNVARYIYIVLVLKLMTKQPELEMFFCWVTLIFEAEESGEVEAVCRKVWGQGSC